MVIMGSILGYLLTRLNDNTATNVIRMLYLAITGSAAIYITMTTLYQKKQKKGLSEIRECCMEMLKPHCHSAIRCVLFGTLHDLQWEEQKCRKLNCPCFVALTYHELFIIRMNLFYELDSATFCKKLKEVEQCNIRKSAVFRQYIITIGFKDCTAKFRLPIYGKIDSQSDQKAQVMEFIDIMRA